MNYQLSGNGNSYTIKIKTTPHHGQAQMILPSSIDHFPLHYHYQSPAFRPRIIALFFLAAMICFGCSKPEVTVPLDPTAQPVPPVQSDTPGYPPPCPRPEPEPEPKIDKTPTVSPARQTIVRTAMTAVGTPYLWGGLSPKGFDCSGLVVYTYGKIGIHVPRTAKAQFKNCRSVARQNIKPADLVFFFGTQKKGRCTRRHLHWQRPICSCPGQGEKGETRLIRQCLL